MGTGLILGMRKQMSECEGGLWIENAWTPSLQRDGDEFIMERFVNIRGVARRQLERANAV